VGPCGSPAVARSRALRLRPAGPPRPQQPRCRGCCGAPALCALPVHRQCLCPCFAGGGGSWLSASRAALLRHCASQRWCRWCAPAEVLGLRLEGRARRPAPAGPQGGRLKGHRWARRRGQMRTPPAGGAARPGGAAQPQRADAKLKIVLQTRPFSFWTGVDSAWPNRYWRHLRRICLSTMATAAAKERNLYSIHLLMASLMQKQLERSSLASESSDDCSESHECIAGLAKKNCLAIKGTQRPRTGPQMEIGPVIEILIEMF
jgi:hypothetical protein